MSWTKESYERLRHSMKCAIWEGKECNCGANDEH